MFQDRFFQPEKHRFYLQKNETAERTMLQIHYELSTNHIPDQSPENEEVDWSVQVVSWLWYQNLTNTCGVSRWLTQVKQVQTCSRACRGYVPTDSPKAENGTKKVKKRDFKKWISGLQFSDPPTFKVVYPSSQEIFGTSPLCCNPGYGVFTWKSV